MQQEGAELVAEPKVAPATDPEGLDVEVATGQQALGRVAVHDLERQAPAGVAKRDGAQDPDVVAAAAGGFEVRVDQVDAQ
jgi:hypothetical protein